MLIGGRGLKKGPNLKTNKILLYKPTLAYNFY